MRALRSIVLVAALSAVAAYAQVDGPSVRFALTKKVFWHNDPQDVIPQAQLVCNEIGRHIGRNLTVDAYGQQAADIRDALVSGKVQFVFSDGLDFVRLQTGRLAPGVQAGPLKVRAIAAVISPPDDQGPTPGCTRAVVVARNDASIRTFADLKGKRLVYGPRSEMDCSMLFLDALVRKQGFAGKEGFFASVKRLSCEDACLISLSRGSADVTCLPEVMLLAKLLVTGNELKDVKSLETSAPYASYLCFYVEGQVDEPLADRIRQELLALHQTPEGAKLLQMFHVARCGPVVGDVTSTIEQLVMQETPSDADAALRATPAPR